MTFPSYNNQNILSPGLSLRIPGQGGKKGKEHDKSWLSPYKGGRMKEPVKERCEQGTVCI